jgi:hypothetical protein
MINELPGMINDLLGIINELLAICKIDHVPIGFRGRRAPTGPHHKRLTMRSERGDQKKRWLVPSLKNERLTTEITEHTAREFRKPQLAEARL